MSATQRNASTDLVDVAPLKAWKAFYANDVTATKAAELWRAFQSCDRRTITIDAKEIALRQSLVVQLPRITIQGGSVPIHLCSAREAVTSGIAFNDSVHLNMLESASLLSYCHSLVYNYSIR